MNNPTETEKSTLKGKPADLTKEIRINAPARRIFQALSTAEGVGKWWSYYATGPSWVDGEVLLKWPSSGHEARIRLAEMKAPTFVSWDVLEHRPFRELTGTTIRFSLEETGSGETKLVYQQVGLVPECECYEVCSNAWDYLVGQIKKLIEQGFA